MCRKQMPMHTRSSCKPKRLLNTDWMLHFQPVFNHMLVIKNFLKKKNCYRLQEVLQWFHLYHWGNLPLARKIGFIATKPDFQWARLRPNLWKFCVFQCMVILLHTRRIVPNWIERERITFDPGMTVAKSWPGPMVIGGVLISPLRTSRLGTYLRLMDGKRIVCSATNPR